MHRTISLLIVTLSVVAYTAHAPFHTLYANERKRAASDVDPIPQPEARSFTFQANANFETAPSASGAFSRKSCLRCRFVAQQHGRQGMSEQQASTVAAMRTEFMNALKNISDERKVNNANGFSCTHFLDSFYVSRDIRSYTEFFKTIGIAPALLDLNRQHYVTFELAYRQLFERGFHGFKPTDTLVLVFTTASSESTEVTSFRAQLVGKTPL